MTYSRPTSRGTSTSPGLSRSNVPSIIGTAGYGPTTPNGELRDYRDPNMYIRNAQQKNRQIQGVLDFFNESVKPAVEKFQAGQAKQQAGAVLSEFDGADLLSGATPEAADAYSSLDWRARDIVMTAAAQQSAIDYQGALQLEKERHPLLKQDVTGNEELETEQAKLWAQVRAIASETAGLGAIPDAQRIGITGALRQYEAEAELQLGRARLNSGKQAQTSTQVGEAEFRFTQAHFEDYKETNKNPNLEYLPLTFEALKNELEQTGDRKDALKVLAQGMIQAVAAQDDADTAIKMADNFKNYANSGNTLEFHGKGNLFNEFVGDSSKTLKQIATELADATRKDRGSPLVRKLQTELLDSISKNDPERTRRLILEAGPQAVSTEEFLQILRLPKAINNALTNPAELSANATALQLRLAERLKGATTNEQKAAIYKEIAGEIIANPNAFPTNFGPNMASRAVELIENGSDPQQKMLERLNDARQTTSVGTTQDVMTLLRARGLDLNRSNINELRVEVDYLTELDYRERYKELDEAGLKEWQPELEYEKSRKTVVDKLMPDGQELSQREPAALFAAATNELQQGLMATNGQIVAAAMPKGLMESLVRTEKIKSPADFDKLPERTRHEYLLNYLAQYRSKDGKSLLTEKDPKDRNAMRNAYRRLIKEMQGRVGGGPQSSAAPAIDSSVAMGITQSELPLGDSIAQFQPDGAAAAVAQEIQFTNTDNPEALALQQEFIQDKINQFKEADSGKAQKLIEGYLKKGLPAMTGNPVAKVENTEEENIQLMERRFANPGNAEVGDAPLPQVSYTAPAPELPLFIGPMHPIFVAIGINEGTRTANGGYTKNWRGHRDVGDGGRNVGTISYDPAREGGNPVSPQQADKIYASRLSRAQVLAKPWLIRSGLVSGTQGYNRMMFNLMDLQVQAPAAVPAFARKIEQMKAANFSIESIAKARADSFYNPATGRLEASGFGNNYQRLYRDQKQRAGTYDYKTRRF